MLKTKTRLGTGIGEYRHSFYKMWIFGGFIYWGMLIFIYFGIAIIIIAMFLPLYRTMERLG